MTDVLNKVAKEIKEVFEYFRWVKDGEDKIYLTDDSIKMLIEVYIELKEYREGLNVS